MSFYDVQERQSKELCASVSTRTFWGENMLVSLVEIDGAMFGDAQAKAFESDKRPFRVGQDDHVLDAKIEEYLRADAIIAKFGVGEVNAVLRFRVPVSSLELVRKILLHRDADNDQYAFFRSADHFHNFLQLACLVVMEIAQHIIQDIEGMDPDQYRTFL